MELNKPAAIDHLKGFLQDMKNKTFSFIKKEENCDGYESKTPLGLRSKNWLYWLS